MERSEEEPTGHQDPDLFVVTLRWESHATVSDYREGRVPGEPWAGGGEELHQQQRTEDTGFVFFLKVSLSF